MATTISPALAGATVSPVSARFGACLARPSMRPASRRWTPERRRPRHGGGVRSPRSRTRPCWQRSAPISPARHGPAKAIAKSGPGCG